LYVLALGFALAGAPGLLAESPAAPSLARQVSDAMADSVAKVLPSVVVIRTEATKLYVDYWRSRLYKSNQPLGQGSGVIISKDGYVLTSAHVIEGAETVEVSLDDGRSFPAEIKGANRATDIAVLKINAPADVSFSPIAVADSDRVRVGELCIAIGSPFSLNSTVTSGVVSQKGRSADILPVVDFIQTSAAINPGNSGGALVDVDGRLIGINTFIQTAGPHAMGNIGIGFAVPSNTALRIADLIIRGGSGDLPYIGIEMRQTEFGVLVARVVPGSPADKAGLRARDLIQRLDGKNTTTVDEVRSLVVLKKPGDTLVIDLLRAGAGERPVERKVSLQVETMPVVRPEMN
jgi:S1-C subfamily serine protease